MLRRHHTRPERWGLLNCGGVAVAVCESRPEFIRRRAPAELRGRHCISGAFGVCQSNMRRAPALARGRVSHSPAEMRQYWSVCVAFAQGWLGGRTNSLGESTSFPTRLHLAWAMV